MSGVQPHHGDAGVKAWRRRWIGLTIAAALVATVCDAVLLQLRRTYFTGGFLAVDSIGSTKELLWFAAGSLLADAAIVGIVLAGVLWLAARAGIVRPVAVPAAFVLALAPIGVADLIDYRLTSFLGDAFDLALMFDLAGRDPAEILAVSSGPLVSLLVLGGGAAAAFIGVFWIWQRRARATGPRLELVPLRRVLPAPFALFLCAVVATGVLCASSDVLENGLRRKPASRFLGAVVDRVSDLDGDGSGILGRPPDPNLLNGQIRPYVVEVPGNGIDEDGVGGDLPAGLEPYTEPAAPVAAWQSKPDVILIVLESFRADALGAMVNGKPVTPVLDALAARGISAAHAYSHNGYTVQSRHHIFSGSVANIRNHSILDDFKAQGYQTGYFSAQDESFGRDDYDVGFSRADVAYDARVEPKRRYSTFTTPGSLAVPFDVVNERVRRFLTTERTERPLFLYVNYHDTHFPYHHNRGIHRLLDSPVLREREIVPERADALRAMYLNTAANVDRAIGDLLNDTRRSLGREPGLIVMSDHGESLFDEGFLGHGYALNDAQTRIPLIVAGLPLTIQEPFGQADLRDLIASALERPGESQAVPQLRQDPERKVFQYLGNLDRPRQIGFIRGGRRVVYDFRGRTAFADGQEPRRIEALEPNTQTEVLDLVRTWERMILAREK